MRVLPHLPHAPLRTLAAAAFACFASAAHAQPTSPAAPTPPGIQVRAVVSIPPLKALVEPLIRAAAGGADSASPPVDILIPPGVSEHGYEIPPARLAALARADVVVSIGLGLEPQVADFLADHPSPARRAVEFAAVAAIAPAANTPDDPHDHDHHDHADHDDDHDHAHLGQDPHLWLDPVLVLRLIPALRQAVEQAAAAASRGGTLDAATRHRLDLAEQSLLARVHATDDEHRTRLAPFKGRSIVVAHDAWGRLAARYDFETVAIKGMLATEPTPQSIKAAVDAIRGHAGTGAKVIFTEPQLAKTSAQRIADAAGARLMELDPLGSGDWFSTMHANLDNIVAALEAQHPGATPAPR